MSTRWTPDADRTEGLAVRGILIGLLLSALLTIAIFGVFMLVYLWVNR